MSALRIRHTATAATTPVWATAAVTVGAVGLAVGFGVGGAGSTRRYLEFAAAALFVPVGLWLFTSSHTDRTLAVVLVYLGCGDGVVRLVSGSPSLTIGRDVLLYAVALGALARLVTRREPIRWPPLSGFVIAWIAVVLIQIANPSGISVKHSLVSVRPDLEFVPLFFLTYSTIRSSDRLWMFLALILFCAAANGIAGLVQVRLSPEALASWGPGYRALIYGSGRQLGTAFGTATGASAVRPPALGGFIYFGGELGVLALPGGIALLTMKRERSGLLPLVIAGLALTAASIFTSQSRSSLLGAVIAMFAFGLLTATSARGIRVLLALFLVAVAGYGVYGFVVPSNDNRYGTIAPRQLSTTLSSTIGVHGTIRDVPLYLVRYPMGAGLGRAGASALSSIGGETTSGGLNGESEATYLLIETGVPGLLTMLGLFAALVRAGWLFRRIASDSLQRGLLALTAVIVFLWVDWIFGAVSGAPPSSPFIWACAGIFAFWLREVRAGRVALTARATRFSHA